jgi:hypothetical protein
LLLLRSAAVGQFCGCCSQLIPAITNDAADNTTCDVMIVLWRWWVQHSNAT